jgi:hypothetical protein
MKNPSGFLFSFFAVSFVKSQDRFPIHCLKHGIQKYGYLYFKLMKKKAFEKKSMGSGFKE